MLSFLTRPGPRNVRRGVIVASLLAMGLVLQAFFLARYPEPILFGDPGAYYVFGQKFRAAFASLGSGATIAEAFDSIRGYLFFAGVGMLYGLIDAASPGDIRTFRLILMGFNVVAMGGVFCLAQSVSGSFRAAALALGLAALYPSFSVQLGRLYPDPVVSALLVWSAWAFAHGMRSARLRFHWLSGLLLGMALYVRAQIFDYIVLLLVVTAGLTSIVWARRAAGRKTVALFALGLLPIFVLFKLGVSSMQGDFRDIEQYGFFAAPQQQRYPYGFWQFLDSDGWIGPYGLEEYPYYLAMKEQAREEPELLTSRRRQYAFTVRYLLSRPWQSMSQLGLNVYRLLSEPANQYRWDYPFPIRLQRVYQRLLVLFGVAGIAWIAAARPAFAFAFFMPVAIASLHALSFPEARYNQPIMPIVIGAAGIWAATLPGLMATAIGRRLALAALGSVVLFGIGALVTVPLLSRTLTVVATLSLTALPFVAAAKRRGEAGRLWPIAAIATLALLVVSIHLSRDRLWHEREHRLDGRYRGFEQEIALAGPAVAELRSAPEVWLFVDLHAADGDVSDLAVEVEGKRFEGSELLPTMPRFGTATVSGARNPRGYPQWWAVRLPPDTLPQRAPATVRLRLTTRSAAAVRFFTDRYRDQERTYEGPSFGDQENRSVLKLVHDGDYRIARRVPLHSAGTKSRLLTREGAAVDTSSVVRARLVTLENVEGRLEWLSAPVPTPDAAVAFFAYTGRAGSAELIVPSGAAIPFPLGSEEDFTVEQSGYRLCHRAQGTANEMAYGGYVVEGRFDPGTVPLSIRFRSGPSDIPMFVSLDRRGDHAELEALWESCRSGDVPRELVNGVSEILDSERNAYPENVGPWRVGRVY